AAAAAPADRQAGMGVGPGQRYSPDRPACPVGIGPDEAARLLDDALHDLRRSGRPGDEGGFAVVPVGAAGRPPLLLALDGQELPGVVFTQPVEVRPVDDALERAVGTADGVEQLHLGLVSHAQVEDRAVERLLLDRLLAPTLDGTRFVFSWHGMLRLIRLQVR